MSLLWTVPPIVVSLGAVAVLLQLRDMTDAAADLTGQLRRIDEVRVAVAEVRAESAAARSSVRTWHSH
jgi:hypothetical protein